MSIDEQIKPFCKYLQKKERSSFTITAYKTDLEQFAKFLNGKLIEKISTKDINKYQKHLIRENNLTEKTASRKLNGIKTFFKFLISQGILKKNPSEGVNYPKVESKAPKRLSQIEYKAIRDTARHETKSFAMIELMLQTGIKIGEASRLKLENVNLNSNSPHIFIKENQSNESRIVELNQPAIACLSEYMKNRAKTRNDEGWLFQTRTGKSIHPRNMRSSLNRIFKKAGVKGATVNDLRNTFICHQIENGMSLKTLAKIVGHKHTSSTELYLQTTERKTPGTKQLIAEL